MDSQPTLRPITAQDEAFLYQVYASTRHDELAMLDWDQGQKEAFLRMQFHAQHKFYQETFNQAEFSLILLDCKPIGRLYIDRRHNELRVIDIALLPAYRGQGIGSGFMHRILNEGQRRGLPVRIHVEHNNPALSLYRRLGFTQIDDTGVYYLMEWVPTSGYIP